MGEAPGLPQHDQRLAAPWLEGIVVAASIAVAGVGAVGLVLAMLGEFDGWLALALGLPLVGAGLWLARPMFRRPSPPDRDATLAAVVAVGLALAAAAWSSFAPSHHVLIDRDPGSYVATAVWIADQGSLEVTAADAAFADVQGLTYASPAVYDLGGGRLQFQFQHLPSAALAVADDLAGSAGLFRLAGVVGAAGLLALYVVAVRVTGRPVLALLAPAALAASMPFVGVVRDVYSEPFAFLLLWAAVAVLDAAVRQGSPALGLVGGALVGATTIVRIDSLLYLALLAPLLGLATLAKGGPPQRTRRAVALTAGAGAVALAGLGVVDLVGFAGDYQEQHADELRNLWLLVGASLVVTGFLVVLGSRLTRAGLRQPVRHGLAVAGGVATVVVLLVGWLVRPKVQTVRSSTELWGLLGDLQVAEGQTVDLRLMYSQDSLVWMAWYLGVAGLTLAIAGAGLMVFRSLLGRATPALVASTALLVCVGGLYWWRPSITPDHLWAMRRYLPAVLPGLAVAACVAIGHLAPAGRRTSWRTAAGGLASLAMLLGPMAVTWPVALQREQHGFDAVVDEACRLAGPRAALVVPAVGTDPLVLPQTLRSWCGVPVAVVDPALLRGDQLASLVTAASEQDRSLAIVTTAPAALEDLRSEGAIPLATSEALATRRLEHTLTRHPERYLADDEAFYIDPSLQLYVVPVVSPVSASA